MTTRVAYGQAKDAHDGLTAAERAAQEADKKARSQAEVLEMIGKCGFLNVTSLQTSLNCCRIGVINGEWNACDTRSGATAIPSFSSAAAIAAIDSRPPEMTVCRGPFIAAIETSA